MAMSKKELRDKYSNLHEFFSFDQAKEGLDSKQRHYNQIKAHGAQNYFPAVMNAKPRGVMHRNLIAKVWH